MAKSSSSKTYELGREVAVTNNNPGKIRRLTVAVALSPTAGQGQAAEIDQIKQLVSAAVGADPARGDQVAVAVRPFPRRCFPAKFYETPWFAMAVRNGVALLAVLLTLLLGVRPLIRALRRDGAGCARRRPKRARSALPPRRGTPTKTAEPDAGSAARACAHRPSPTPA
jgi:flagellar M-ring protein FliF